MIAAVYVTQRKGKYERSRVSEFPVLDKIFARQRRLRFRPKNTKAIMRVIHNAANKTVLAKDTAEIITFALTLSSYILVTCASL